MGAAAHGMLPGSGCSCDSAEEPTAESMHRSGCSASSLKQVQLSTQQEAAMDNMNMWVCRNVLCAQLCAGLRGGPKLGTSEAWITMTLSRCVEIV